MRIDQATVSARLVDLPGWSGSTTEISKQYVFANFVESMKFVNEVAAIAERRNHHPDIAIAWNRVTLRITSHSQGGVTAACLDLATDIENLVPAV